MVKVARTGNRDTDSLIYGYKWGALALTYSFPTSGAQYGDGYVEATSNFEPLNSVQQAAARGVLAQLASFTRLAFTQQAGAAGTLLFGMTDAVETAAGYLPSELPEGGDTWYNNSGGDYDNPARGSYGYLGFMHEVGHALGLDHPHEAAVPMSLSHDSLEYTVMSYRNYPGQSLDEGVGGYGVNLPITFMMYDIAALQHMYGANFATNSGNTVYEWDPSLGFMSVNGEGKGGQRGVVFMTLWDGGGIDTFNLGNHPYVEVDLRPGGWTKLSWGLTADLGDSQKARGSIANPFLYKGDTRSLIENVIAGSGHDKIRGNQVANQLDGRGGNDTLIGDAGDDILIGGRGGDTMHGGSGNDTYWVDYERDTVTDVANGGIDLVKSSVAFVLGPHVENLLLLGTAAAAGTGNGGNNNMVGNSGANLLKGQAGNDTINGVGGDDKIYGGLGNDVLKGDVGIDRFCFDTPLSSTANVDRLSSFVPADDTILLDRDIFTAFTATGTISASAFRVGTEAADASDRIIYHKNTGRIFYDPDGNGPADQILFATVTPGTALTSVDFAAYI